MTFLRTLLDQWLPRNFVTPPLPVKGTLNDHCVAKVQTALEAISHDPQLQQLLVKLQESNTLQSITCIPSEVFKAKLPGYAASDFKLHRIVLDSSESEAHLISGIIFEILNMTEQKHSFNALQEKARQGVLSKEQYATQVRELEVKTQELYNAIVEKGLANKWWVDVPLYTNKKPSSLSSAVLGDDRAITAHKRFYTDQWDRLQKNR